MSCAIWCQYIVLWHQKCAGQSKSLIQHRCLFYRLIPFLCYIIASIHCLFLLYIRFIINCYFQLLKLLVEKKWGVKYQSWEEFRENEAMVMYVKAALVNGTIEDLEDKVKKW